MPQAIFSILVTLVFLTLSVTLTGSFAAPVYILGAELAVFVVSVLVGTIFMSMTGKSLTENKALIERIGKQPFYSALLSVSMYGLTAILLLVFAPPQYAIGLAFLTLIMNVGKLALTRLIYGHNPGAAK